MGRKLICKTNQLFQSQRKPFQLYFYSLERFTVKYLCVCVFVCMAEWEIAFEYIPKMAEFSVNVNENATNLNSVHFVHHSWMMKSVSPSIRYYRHGHVYHLQWFCYNSNWLSIVRCNWWIWMSNTSKWACDPTGYRNRIYSLCEW